MRNSPGRPSLWATIGKVRPSSTAERIIATVPVGANTLTPNASENSWATPPSVAPVEHATNTTPACG